MPAECSADLWAWVPGVRPWWGRWSHTGAADTSIKVDFGHIVLADGDCLHLTPLQTDLTGRALIRVYRGIIVR